MFEQWRLLGSTERSIVVQTHKGRNIENIVEVEAGEHERRKYELLLRQYGRSWEHRKPATGIYNCVGHVWASRRTMVLKNLDLQVKMILDDDGYRRVNEQAEPVMPGDVVIYRERGRGEDDGFIHVGIVHELREGVSPRSPRIPWVLSKWDSTSGEVLHHFMDVPFEKQGFPFVCEFRTDRPMPRTEPQS
jgi:hypothetical protein